MLGKYAITDGEKTVGELEVSRRGMMYRFEARCTGEEERQGMTRLRLWCGEISADIGVLSPSDGGWTLGRSFSPQSLRQMGVDRIDLCTAEHESERWVREDEPRRLFEDAELKRVCLDMYDTLSAVSGEKVLLAVPIESRRPFPAMPIFCFGEAKRIGGRDYVVFTLRDGQLC